MTVNDDDSFGRESPVTGAEPVRYEVTPTRFKNVKLTL